ncbi:hypothetical protein [Desulfonatronospira sp.]|uniref:hypothetical protein n=1 Tax=Desulfonatronospira sp. TaxID=1962951 RepID=UPI0025B8D31C|nr:hypothetical protein [Desulfonatronospira sp.]
MSKHLRQSRIEAVRVLAHEKSAAVLKTMAMLHPEWNLKMTAESSYIKADFERRREVND